MLIISNVLVIFISLDEFINHILFPKNALTLLRYFSRVSGSEILSDVDNLNFKRYYLCLKTDIKLTSDF